jgi:hypothetical protein
MTLSYRSWSAYVNTPEILLWTERARCVPSIRKLLIRGRLRRDQDLQSVADEGGCQRMSGNAEEALEVLREVWSAREQTARDIEKTRGTGKSCQRMTDVGFDGLAEETDGDLRPAWRTQLAREGKLNRGAGSVRDLVLGSGS